MSAVGDILTTKNLNTLQVFDTSGNLVNLASGAIEDSWVVLEVDGGGNPTRVVKSGGGGSSPSTPSYVVQNISQTDTILNRNLETGTLDAVNWLQIMASNVARVQWFLQNVTGVEIVIGVGEAGSEVEVARLANGASLDDQPYADLIKTHRISAKVLTGTQVLSSAINGAKILAHEISNS